MSPALTPGQRLAITYLVALFGAFVLMHLAAVEF